MEQALTIPPYEDIITNVIVNNQDRYNQAVDNEKLIGWFVGQAMIQCRGKANPHVFYNIMELRIAATKEALSKFKDDF